MIGKALLIGVLSLVLGGLAGCGDDPAPTTVPAQPTQAVQKVAAEVDMTTPQPKAPDYVYSPSGKRDPFVPLLEVKKPVTGAGVPLTPLQKFDLGQLKIVGIILGRGEPTAMVTVPGGKSFILKEGIKVGKNNGTVTKITSDGIFVEEKYYDFSGAVRTNTQAIKLPPRRGVN